MLPFDASSYSPVVVVIPSYNESVDELTATLQSLVSAKEQSSYAPIVLVLINYKKDDAAEIKLHSSAVYAQLVDLTFDLDVHFFIEELSHKKAGVGLARKILMDTAFSYYAKLERDGVIVNLDADTQVQKNYFNCIHHFFQHNQSLDAASIAFAHRMENVPQEEKDAIIEYELHLRYFINMQRRIGLPYAYQTIGSAMACRAFAYAKYGGMPKRQAGEDFYFIHKFTSVQRLGEINDTCVYPSSRPSDRVPFGTGKAVNKRVGEGVLLKSYNYRSFQLLGEWIQKLLNAYPFQDKSFKDILTMTGDEALKSFLDSIDANEAVLSIANNTASKENFTNRFFQWFDAFTLMKYLHWVRDYAYRDLDIDVCISYLFSLLQLKYLEDMESNLIQMRLYDRENEYKDFSGAQI